jgi:hypothetical protein
MEAKNIRKSPDLPQEIIDIIVHEIASQDLTGETLRACSLVSKPFCFSCRRHLFSDIKLVSDKFSQSRASRLVKVLQNPDNIGLTACVRSLTLILHVPSSRAYPFPGSWNIDRRLYKWKMMMLTLASRLHLYENNLFKALNLLMQTPLESFTLHTRGAAPDWENEVGVAEGIKKAILITCTAHLTTLRLSNLVNIDESLITRVVHSSTLKELALTHLTLRVCDGDANLDLQPITSQVERLDLRHISYMQVLRTMGRPTLPTLPMPYPFITFSRLRNLTISGHGSNLEMDTLSQFMLGVANTLETLEIEEVNWEGN